MTSRRSRPQPAEWLVRRSDDVRWRWLGAAALGSALLPVSRKAEGGLYLWELVAVASLADALRLLAPALLGVALLALTLPRSLGRLGQSVLALLALCLATGAATSSGVALQEAFRGLLDFVGRRPLLVALGLSLVGAGAELRGPGTDLRVSPQTRRLARWLLAGGAILVILVYLLPQRGRPFGLLLVEHMVAAARAGGSRLVAGQVLFWLLGLLPLGLAVGAVAACRRSARPGIGLGFGARYGLSLLAVLLCFRLLVLEHSATAVLVQIRAALLLALFVGVASRGVEQLARHVLDAPLPPTPPASRLARDVRLREHVRAYLGADRAADTLWSVPGVPVSHRCLGWLMRRRLGEVVAELSEPVADAARPGPLLARRYLEVLTSALEPTAVAAPQPDPSSPSAPSRSADEPAASWPGQLALWLASGHRRLPMALGALAALLVGLLGWRLWRPPADLRWTLGAATEAADELFGTELPRYVVALARHDERAAKGQGAAEAGQALREQAAALHSAAQALDPLLAQRVDDLVRAAAVVDRTGELWIGAVHELNRRVRTLGLPYYVDGNVMQWQGGFDGPERRLFYVTTYRVERLRPAPQQDRPYACLHARRLDRLNIVGSRLGAVRSDEPFALVMVDAIERAVDTRLAALRSARSCGFGRERIGDGLDDPLAAIAVDELCAEMLLAAIAPPPAHDAAGSAQTRRRLVALGIDATERHELQHQLDRDDLEVPKQVWDLLPWASDESALLVAQEASASLAELGPVEPLGLLWRIADLSAHLIEGGSRSPYRYAAALVLGELAGRPLLGTDGRLDTAALSGYWQQLRAEGDALGSSLSARARHMHVQAFGTPMVTLAALAPAELPLPAPPDGGHGGADGWHPAADGGML